MPGSGYTSGLCVCVCVCVQSIVLYLCPSDRCGVGGLQRAARTNARTSCCCVAPPRSRGPRRRPEVANGAIAAALSVTNGFAGCGRSIGATLRTMPGGSRTGRLEKIRQEKIGFEGLSQSRFLAPCPSSEPRENQARRRTATRPLVAGGCNRERRSRAANHGNTVPGARSVAANHHA